LLAVAKQNGDWVVGGIGDGLLAVRTGDDSASCFVGDRHDSFGNETFALGTSVGAKTWKLTLLPSTPFERLVVLATDGVSDDLVPDKIDGFCNWIVEDFQNLDPAVRWRRIAAELRGWPTHKHLDDKTIAVLKISAEASEEMV
jgi:hypothetical protein